MSAVVKNVDSLMSTSGRIIHLFSFLLVIHYCEDKKRHRMPFKCSFSGMLSCARAKSSCQSLLAIGFFKSVLLALRSINLAKTTIWILRTRGPLLHFATETDWKVLDIVHAVLDLLPTRCLCSLAHCGSPVLFSEAKPSVAVEMLVNSVLANSAVMSWSPRQT